MSNDGDNLTDKEKRINELVDALTEKFIPHLRNNLKQLHAPINDEQYHAYAKEIVLKIVGTLREIGSISLTQIDSALLPRKYNRTFVYNEHIGEISKATGIGTMNIHGALLVWCRAVRGENRVIPDEMEELLRLEGVLQ